MDLMPPDQFGKFLNAMPEDRGVEFAIACRQQAQREGKSAAYVAAIDSFLATKTPPAVAPPAAAQAPTQYITLYHGTSWAAGQSIISSDKFIPSEDGCLSRGVYAAAEDKAQRFAVMRNGDEGAVLEVVCEYTRAKHVASNDSSWRSEGYDACFATSTSASTNFEWCFKDAQQVKVKRIRKVKAGWGDVHSLAPGDLVPLNHGLNFG